MAKGWLTVGQEMKRTAKTPALKGDEQHAQRPTKPKTASSVVRLPSVEGVLCPRCGTGLDWWKGLPLCPRCGWREGCCD